MARAQGFTCDQDDCGSFVAHKGSDQTRRPPGWLRLQLPEVEQDTRPEDNYRDFCSDKCCEKFVKERRIANTPERSTRPASRGVDARLAEWLDAAGVAPRLRGQVISVHNRAHQGERTKDDCPVCQFEAEASAA